MATKKAVVKNTAATKPVPAQKEPAKKPVNRVSLKITSRATIAKPTVEDVAKSEEESAKAIELAQSIALRLKRNAAMSEQKERESEIHLARRPTTRAQGKNTVKFPPADLKDFRKRLLEAREAALADINAMRATGFNEADDHEADGGDGTNQTLRLQALGQVGAINRTVQQIEEALHRIDDGTYGVCTACGQLIRKPRLLNQPFVLTCMECQSEMERDKRK